MCSTLGLSSMTFPMAHKRSWRFCLVPGFIKNHHLSWGCRGSKHSRSCNCTCNAQGTRLILSAFRAHSQELSVLRASFHYFGPLSFLLRSKKASDIVHIWRTCYCVVSITYVSNPKLGLKEVVFRVLRPLKPLNPGSLVKFCLRTTTINYCGTSP